jgi:ABC-type lipoprotein export system ATPase subunit
MSEAALELRGVKRHFDQGLVRALDGVDLTVAVRETVAIVGPSGSGKSTLLNLAGTLDFASEGTVRIFGEAVAPRMARGRLDHLRRSVIGFVFQQHHLLANYTLCENVELALRPRGIVGAAARGRAAQLLDQVGLAARRDFLPVRVSAGERQRAALARALANDPRIILADEPTGNLDSHNGQAVLDLLLERSAACGSTLLVVTHNPEIAARLGRTIVLRDGRIEREH